MNTIGSIVGRSHSSQTSCRCPSILHALGFCAKNSRDGDDALNLKYLGDALDHWKGSLFESLQREKLVDEFAVDPMASDLSSWREEDFRLLARLLRVHRHQVIHHGTSLSD